MSTDVECPFNQHLIFEPVVQIIFSVIYLIIAILGVFGNIQMIISTVKQYLQVETSNICLLLRSRILWVNTRMFLINMAVSDIIICITSVPITPYTAFTGRNLLDLSMLLEIRGFMYHVFSSMFWFAGNWIFGEIFCHLMPMIQVFPKSNQYL